MTDKPTTFSIRLDVAMDRRVRKTATALGMTRGAVIRECVKKGLGALEAQADQRLAAFGDAIDEEYAHAVVTGYLSQFGKPGSAERHTAERALIENQHRAQEQA